MKKFILSLLIICLSFEQTFLSNAFAQTETSPVVISSPSSQASSQGTPYPVEKFEGVDNGMAVAVTYMAAILIAFLGVSLPMMCSIKKVPSMVIFEIGSAVYLLGEFYTTLQYKKLSMDTLTVYLNSDLDKQLSSLKDIKKMNEGYLNTLKLKYYLAIGVAVVYAIAGIAAAIEAGKAAAEPPCVPKKVKDSATALKKKNTPFFLSLLLPEALATNTSSDSSSDSGGISSTLGFDNINFENLKETSSIVKLILFGAGGAIGAGLAYAFNHAKAGTQGSFKKFINSPYTRIGLFFGCAALIGTLIYLISGQKKKLEDRIAYLDNTIKTLENYSSQRASSLTSSESGYLTASDYVPPIAISSENMGQIASSSQNICIQSNPKDQDQLSVDSKCACASTSSGCQINNIASNTLESAKFPSTIVDTIGSATKALQSLANGNSGSALSNLGSIAKQAGNIKKIQNASIDKLNQKLKKEGKDPLNIKNDQEKFFKGITQNVEKGLKASKIKDSDLEKMGNGIMGLSNESENPDKEKQESTDSKNLPETLKGKEGKGDSQESLNKAEKNPSDENFMLGDIKLDNEKDIHKNDVLPSDSNNYIIESDSKSEIRNDSDYIFDILSDRYRKTAYPNFFKKK